MSIYYVCFLNHKDGKRQNMGALSVKSQQCDGCQVIFQIESACFTYHYALLTKKVHSEHFLCIKSCEL